MRVSKVNRIYGNRLSPTDQGEIDKELKQWKHNSPDRINMRDRIECNTAQISSGVVSKPVRHPGMRCLVNAQGKKQNGKLNGDRTNIDISK